MSLFSNLKFFFLRGLYLLFPIIVTIYILKIIFSFFHSFILFINLYFNFLTIYDIKYSELFILTILVIFLGIIIHYTNMEKFIYTIEKNIIHQIPIINLIYNGIKKLTHIIKKNKASHNKNDLVVWIKLPTLNIYSLGFVIGELEKKYCPNEEKKYFSIFIPTTPNPMTGYYTIAAEEEFIYNNMSRDEAISIIISGGIIRPE